MTYKKRLLTTRNDSQTSTELCLQYQVWAEFIASLKKGAEDRGVLLQHYELLAGSAIVSYFQLKSE